jgi:hypothetical protein
MVIVIIIKIEIVLIIVIVTVTGTVIRAITVIMIIEIIVKMIIITILFKIEPEVSLVRASCAMGSSIAAGGFLDSSQSSVPRMTRRIP